MRYHGIVCRESCISLGRRKLKSQRIAERVSRRGCETCVPHQVRVEGCICRCGSSPLIAWTRTVASYMVVILNTDSDGLSVTHPVRWRVTSTTRVVTVQSAYHIEPK